MIKPSKVALILGLAGAMAALPPLIADQKDPDAAGVAEAIRFEKAKQAAADRQARIEATQGRGENTADRMMPEAKSRAHAVKSTAARKAPPAH
jgi:hypothetical protein